MSLRDMNELEPRGARPIVPCECCYEIGHAYIDICDLDGTALYLYCPTCKQTSGHK